MAMRRSTWERWGFLPPEIEEFRRVSRNGTHSPYVHRMIEHRRAIRRNATKYNWSNERYVDYILDEYEKLTGNRTFGKDKLGFDNIWQYYRAWEAMGYRRGEEYESPWRKKVRVGGKRQLGVSSYQLNQSIVRVIDKKLLTEHNSSKRRELEQRRAQALIHIYEHDDKLTGNTE